MPPSTRSPFHCGGSEAGGEGSRGGRRGPESPVRSATGPAQSACLPHPRSCRPLGSGPAHINSFVVWRDEGRQYHVEGSLFATYQCWTAGPMRACDSRRGLRSVSENSRGLLRISCPDILWISPCPQPLLRLTSSGSLPSSRSRISKHFPQTPRLRRHPEDHAEQGLARRLQRELPGRCRSADCFPRLLNAAL
jgi:hypothetical protein